MPSSSLVEHWAAAGSLDNNQSFTILTELKGAEVNRWSSARASGCRTARHSSDTWPALALSFDNHLACARSSMPCAVQMYVSQQSISGLARRPGTSGPHIVANGVGRATFLRQADALVLARMLDLAKPLDTVHETPSVSHIKLSGRQVPRGRSRTSHRLFRKVGRGFQNAKLHLSWPLHASLLNLSARVDCADSGRPKPRFWAT